MEPQQLLFFPADEATAAETKPLVHRADPITSLMAARELVESGRLGQQLHAVLAALRAWSGSTSDELAEQSGIDRFVCARRLPDLARLGLAKKGPRRESRMTGRQGVTWEII